MWHGPQPQSRAERLQITDRIVADLHRTYGDKLKAIALYGSLSRGTDHAYSDVELWVVINQPGVDMCEEWVYGPSKAEVGIYSEDVMRASAVSIDSMWSLRQGELTNCRPLFGDLAFFNELRALVMSPPQKSFNDVIAEMVVGEFFEWMGKIRNGVALDDLMFLPITTVNFTLHMALMAALVHKHIYTTSRTLMREALALPTLPDGYAELVGMVTTGNLHDKPKIVDTLERVWAGMEPWLAGHGITFDERNAWPWA